MGFLHVKENFFSRLGKILTGKTIIDDRTLDELEEILLTADIGSATATEIIDSLKKKVEKEKKVGPGRLRELLKEEILSLLIENNFDFSLPSSASAAPFVMLTVGVNGTGKTTTIGKLAWKFRQGGKTVMLGAADTFRAAAIEQLTLWSRHVHASVVSQGMNADPAAVAFDTVQSAKAKKIDVVLIDTAGRLHNKTALMNELSKIKRVIQKTGNGPHEVLLVLDASTGQNAFEQCRQFSEVTHITSIALTKLDGTAKGGVVIGLSAQFKIPVRFIGTGEGRDDLRLFNKTEFVNALLTPDTQ